jgi:predicted small lipoprotein YifL
MIPIKRIKRFILNIFKNWITIFHSAIIASLMFSMSGCGYKAPPYIKQEAPKGDKNVKFIIKEKRFNTDNNESCSDK